ncbi:hypothetical protein SLE2022_014240 [Rubroshorea leprosula]
MSSNETSPVIAFFMMLNLFPFFDAIDTIAQTHFISDAINEAIISSNGNFRLGFFSLINSPSRYIGVWFNRVSKPSVGSPTGKLHFRTLQAYPGSLEMGTLSFSTAMGTLLSGPLMFPCQAPTQHQSSYLQVISFCYLEMGPVKPPPTYGKVLIIPLTQSYLE